MSNSKFPHALECKCRHPYEWQCSLCTSSIFCSLKLCLDNCPSLVTFVSSIFASTFLRFSIASPSPYGAFCSVCPPSTACKSGLWFYAQKHNESVLCMLSRFSFRIQNNLFNFITRLSVVIFFRGVFVF